MASWLGPAHEVSDPLFEVRVLLHCENYYLFLPHGRNSSKTLQQRKWFQEGAGGNDVQ